MSGLRDTNFFGCERNVLSMGVEKEGGKKERRSTEYPRWHGMAWRGLATILFRSHAEYLPHQQREETAFIRACMEGRKI